MITYTNMLGGDMSIEQYTVEESGKTMSYTTYDGGQTWTKSAGAIASFDMPIGNNIEEFANIFENGRIVETSTGYTVTGQMRAEEDGMLLKLDCEIYIDTEGKVSGYKMYLSEPFKGEEEGMEITMTKFDIEYESDCPEVEIPAEALNAKEGDYIKVRLPSGKKVEGKIEKINKENDQEVTLVISISEGIEELSLYRKVSVDIIWWNSSGYKVPKTAIYEENK